MKATTALISINGEARLKVLLTPEDEKEKAFLIEALEKAEGYDLSADVGDAPAEAG